MSAFSYTIAPYLRMEIEEIEKTRSKILLTLLSPHEKTRIIWDSMVSSTYFSIRLANLNLRKVSIANSLSPKETSKLSGEEKLIYAHKKSFDYLYQDWSLSSKPITAQAVSTIQKFFGAKNGQIDERNLNTLLEFIQVSSEHPIIQAALAHILLLRGLGYSPEGERLARFVAYMFLYKFGYDMDRRIDLEQHFFQHLAAYSEAMEKNLQGDNVSGFIEFYILAFRQQLDDVYTKIAEKKFDITYPDEFFELTERQKEILALFDEPGIKVSNKIIQNLCKVSQITASRDLARLNTLGLIFVHGKGRSVYYTKE